MSTEEHREHVRGTTQQVHMIDEMPEDLKALMIDGLERDKGIPIEVFRRIIDGENPVRVIREWCGLAQADLARKAGIHRVQLHDIETGKSRGSVDTLRAIAVALDVGMDDVV